VTRVEAIAAAMTTAERIHDEDHDLDLAVLRPKTNVKGHQVVISVDPCVTRTSLQNADEKANVHPGLPTDQHPTNLHDTEAAVTKNNDRVSTGDNSFTILIFLPCDISPFALKNLLLFLSMI